MTTTREPPVEPGPGAGPAQPPAVAPGAKTTVSVRPTVVAIAIAVGLVVLAVGVILALGGGRTREYPRDSPEGAVQGYVRALAANEPTTAYGLLSARLQGQLSLANFTDRIRMYGYDPAGGDHQVVRIDRTAVSGDRATVDLTVERYYGNGGLGGGSSTLHPSLQLVRESGGWRLDQLYVGPELMPEMP